MAVINSLIYAAVVTLWACLLVLSAAMVAKGRTKIGIALWMSALFMVIFFGTLQLSTGGVAD